MKLAKNPLARVKRNSIESKEKKKEGTVEVLDWRKGELSKSKPTILKSSKTTQKPPAKIIVPADAFNLFEVEKLRKENDKKIKPNTDDTPKASVITIDDDNSNENQSNVHESKMTVPADAFNSFEEVLIKKEISDDVTNTEKVCNLDSVGNAPIKVVGEPQKDNKPTTEVSTSATVPLKPAKTQGKPVFIITNQAGKLITIRPKTTPVLINKTTPKIVPNLVDSSTNTTVVKTEKLVSEESENKTKSAPVLTISDINKSQKYFMPKPVQKTIKTLHPKVKFVPKKTLQNVLTDEMSDIPMYVHNQTQTDTINKVKDCAVQTDESAISSNIEDLPNITDLVEYLLDTEKYSSGLDEIKKSDLLDMSKNIIMKGKMGPNEVKTVTAPVIPRQQDRLKVQLFMDLKNCLNVDFLGNLPIHNAILENNMNLVKRQLFALKIRNIPIDIENNQRQTSLQLAVINNSSSDIIRTLLEYGADVNVRDSEGNTMLHLSVMYSTDLVLGIILKFCRPPIFVINFKNDEGLTPLMLSAIESKAEMVEVLLKYGANPNLRDDKSGRTALFHAVELNSNYVINLLLKFKADPKIRNFFGLTALDAAKDLEIPDASLLEGEDCAPPPQSTTGPFNAANLLTAGTNVITTKRNTAPVVTYEPAKKSKLSFVSSLQKVELSKIQKPRRSKVIGVAK